MAEIISLIIPCYNESNCVKPIYGELKSLANKMATVMFEFIFIDDGSNDDTLALIKELAQEDSRIQYISFSRNFGKEAAIYSGLEYATGEYIAILDADMQDPPELIEQMLNIIKAGEVDCVATRRVNRQGEPPIRSLFSRMFYKLYNRLSSVQIMEGARDFRLMSRKMVDAIVSLKERNRFSKGLFSWVGFKTEYIEYENRPRKYGNTKWSFLKLFVYSMEGIVSFSTILLTLVSIVGIFICFISFLAILYFIIIKIFKGIDVSGYAAMMCAILFLGGIQLLGIGVVGQYLSRVFFETKNRPLYIVKDCSREIHDRHYI